MKQRGLLFKNDKVHKGDLNYLHTIPYMKAVEAIREVSLDPGNTICDNCQTTKKFRDLIPYCTLVKESSDATCFSRVSNMIENAREIIDDPYIKDDVCNLIEERVDTHERIVKCLEHATEIMNRCELHSLRDFMTCDVIPMKLDDYYMSHERSELIKEDVNESSQDENYIKEKWNAFIESWFNEDYHSAAKIMDLFCESMGLSYDTKKSLFEDVTREEYEAYTKATKSDMIEESVIDTSMLRVISIPFDYQSLLPTRYTKDNLQKAFMECGIENIHDCISEDNVKRIIESACFPSIGLYCYMDDNGHFVESTLARNSDGQLYMLIETTDDSGDDSIYSIEVTNKINVTTEKLNLNKNISFRDNLDA